MKKDLYFVSYSVKHPEGSGFGSCEVWKDNDGLVVHEAAREIEKKFGFPKNSVVILYFKRFEKGESYYLGDKE